MNGYTEAERLAAEWRRKIREEESKISHYDRRSRSRSGRRHRDHEEDYNRKKRDYFDNKRDRGKSDKYSKVENSYKSDDSTRERKSRKRSRSRDGKGRDKAPLRKISDNIDSEEKEDDVPWVIDKKGDKGLLEKPPTKLVLREVVNIITANQKVIPHYMPDPNYELIGSFGINLDSKSKKDKVGGVKSKIIDDPLPKHGVKLSWIEREEFKADLNRSSHRDGRASPTYSPYRGNTLDEQNRNLLDSERVLYDGQRRSRSRSRSRSRRKRSRSRSEWSRSSSRSSRSRGSSIDRKRKIESKWGHDKYDPNASERSPKLLPADYKPPSPTWMSRAGGVALIRRSVAQK